MAADWLCVVFIFLKFCEICNAKFTSQFCALENSNIGKCVPIAFCPKATNLTKSESDHLTRTCDSGTICCRVAAKIVTPTNSNPAQRSAPATPMVMVTENWPGFCNNGSSQSPIDIPKSTVNPRGAIPVLKFQDWDKAFETTVKNNGHTISVAIPGHIKPTLSGGDLNGIYNFENLHFHWPAEHTVGGQSFNLEAHVVFYSNTFPNFTTALNDKNGVAVIGIFYNGIITESPAIFDTLSSAAEQISKQVDLETKAKPIVFQDLLPNNSSTFYYYRGSLTTPDCNEVVSWYILQNVGQIRSKQYSSLTTIYGSDNQVLTFNNRNIQPLNSRVVYSQFD